MKYFTLLLVALSLSACWDDSKPKTKSASEFMSNLNKCDNCNIDKPFLGGEE